MRERIGEHLVHTTGRAVWVYKNGKVIGQYTKLAHQILRPDDTAVINTTPGNWELFVTLLKKYYGLELSDNLRPRESIL